MEQQQISALVNEQRAYFESGKTLCVCRRKEALKKLYAAIVSREKQLTDALQKDLGKSDFESYMCEIGLVLDEISYMLKHIESFAKEKRVRTPLAQFASRSYVKPSPYGVVLIMSPWNYPFLLTIDPLVDALAAGNTAVIKPGAYAPATALAIKELIESTFPREYVSVVTGGRAENACLLDQKFDSIFFTGSKTVKNSTISFLPAARLLEKRLCEKPPNILLPSRSSLVERALALSIRPPTLPLRQRELLLVNISTAGKPVSPPITCFATHRCVSASLNS